MKIEIVPYQPVWPLEFQTIAAALHHALGPLALRIDHIGSTSVPGLAAKDRIDIQITVAALTEDVEQALNSIGYERKLAYDRDHVPPSGPFEPAQWAKWIFTPPAGQRPTNTHVRVAGRANQRYALLFRDYLRADSAAAEAYARIKIALARQHPEDIEAYLDVKDPVCDLIIGAAERWAASAGWQHGPASYP